MNALRILLQNPGFHMHDCYITRAVLSQQSLSFELAQGLYILKAGEYVRTGPAKLTFSKLISPGYEIQYLRDSRREGVGFEVLQKDLQSGYIDLIYEMYNETSAYFEGILIQESGWKTVEIKVFFHGLEILYEEGVATENE
ncbi:hypothetical protein Ami103574_01725 [Aminipila butyrica]|uniref:Uncharacterized protein n=1 Tax=Aminipila butyrica TaxID=433296 RepID=A0A858BVK4_9FIRM|nr:hypothetical protein [Aminipila butyrica]QIB68106.1 hypothetical protein Ami103574_01725 [Aminipila butyrica]